MADDQTVADTTTQQQQAPEGDSHWKAEAAKAFKARDEIKARMRELEGKVMSDEDRQLFDKLRADAEKTEEERKRKAGEFDTWRADIVKKHDEALKTEAQKREAAEAKLRQRLIGLEFAAATSLFGDNGKTVLTPAIAEAYFGRFVDVVTDDSGHESVVVKGADGHVVLNVKTGKPAAFAEALAEVIDGLPDKDRILRGSGKTGSGSSGGASGRSADAPIDASNLTPEQRRDPNVLKRLRAQQPRGGMVFGTAYEQQ